MADGDSKHPTHSSQQLILPYAMSPQIAPEPKERGTKYTQPFLERFPLDQYPEIQQIVKKEFPDESPAVRNNLYTIIAQFLRVPVVAASRRPQWYRKLTAPDWFNYDDAVRAQDILAEKGLINIALGRRARPGFATGFASRLSSTRQLDDLVRHIILKEPTADFTNAEPLTLDRFPLHPSVINGLSCPNVVRAGPLDADRLVACYHEMRELNAEYFAGMRLSFNGTAPRTMEEARALTERFRPQKHGKHPVHLAKTNVHLTRMFSGLGMGRLFQRGCISYMNIAKEDRRHTRINGEPTAELDFSSMHVNLAYFMTRKPNPHLQDSYGPIVELLGIRRDGYVEGEFESVRKAVKRCVLVAFNSKDQKQYNLAMRYNYPAEAGTLITRGFTFDDVFEAFMRAHPALRRPFMERTYKADALMFHESQIMMRCLQETKAAGANALPLHDGIICDARHSEAVKRVMLDTYRDHTGNDIRVK